MGIENKKPSVQKWKCKEEKRNVRPHSESDCFGEKPRCCTFLRYIENCRHGETDAAPRQTLANGQPQFESGNNKFILMDPRRFSCQAVIVEENTVEHFGHFATGKLPIEQMEE
jgi:hypothetical protein